MARQENRVESARLTWTPVIDKINSLMDTICALDNDETKCVDILAKHIKRIQKAIPPNTVFIQYPKPIHRLLSIQPLKRIEIPLEILDILVSSGFEVNEYYNDGSNYYGYSSKHNAMKVTCLHLALKNHHYNAARWLVEHGADCNKCSFEESLCSHNYSYITPITMLASHRNAPLDLFSKLKTTKNLNDSNLPLIVAAKYGHTDIARHLIELLSNLNYINRGNLPLTKHHASASQNDRSLDLPLHIAIRVGHTELALSLIKHGSSLDQEDSFGDPPLHTAVKVGQTELVLSLIKHGAYVNQKCRSGDLPLHIAIRVGHTELALSLIKHGSSLDQEDRFGDPSLHIAVKVGHTELVLSLIKHSAYVNQKYGSGDLPLHIAIRVCCTELALSLIKHGSSVNQEDRFGDPPLHITIQDGHTELVSPLIKHGASVSQSCINGCLPSICYGNKVGIDAKFFNDEIFTNLIPESNMDILKIIFQLFDKKGPIDTKGPVPLERIAICECKAFTNLPNRSLFVSIRPIIV